MDGMRPFKAQGSFGIPEQMKKELERRATEKVKPEEKTPSDKTEAKESEEQKEDANKEEKEKSQDDKVALLEAKKYWEEKLEISINGKDLQDYIFKGRLRKDKVFVASFADPKVESAEVDFRVTFQSHTPSDSAEIDEKMSDFRTKGKFTPDGLENEKALIVLSYGLLEADGRPLGRTPEERYKNIKNFGSHLVDYIAEAWRGFNFLIRVSLQEKKLLKKQ